MLLLLLFCKQQLMQQVKLFAEKDFAFLLKKKSPRCSWSHASALCSSSNNFIVRARMCNALCIWIKCCAYASVLQWSFRSDASWCRRTTAAAAAASTAFLRALLFKQNFRFVFVFVVVAITVRWKWRENLYSEAGCGIKSICLLQLWLTKLIKSPSEDDFLSVRTRSESQVFLFLFLYIVRRNFSLRVLLHFILRQ